jgi:hypothetical protein
MLGKDLVTDNDGNTLSADSQEVKDFLALEEVRMALMDEELFHYLYEQLTKLEDPATSGWNI